MRYLVFHKPYGVVSQFTPLGDHATLADYIPIPNVYAVGRLDADSEGLLLLTDDGPLQHRLSDPKFQHPRTYWVQVEHIPNDEAIEHLCRGVTIQNYRTLPARVQLLEPPPAMPPRQPPIRERRQIPTAWLELVLTEGKNRQVRRMTAAVGHPTLRLIRVAIGPCQLAGLPLGQWRDVTPVELEDLRQLSPVPSRRVPR
jgi:23S rRNA pseudouridine2457 synthase